MHVNPGLAGYDFYRSWVGQQAMPALQYLFPSLTPELGTEQQQAALETRTVPAPETEAKMRTWSIDDIYEAIAQKGKAVQVVLTAGVHQGEPVDLTGAAGKRPTGCGWHETLGADGACHVGGWKFWLVAGGGVTGLLYLLRRNG